jgi:cell division protein FtsB
MKTMNVGLSIWDKLTRLVVVLSLVAAVLAVILWYRPLIQQNERLRQRKLNLEQQIQQALETGKRIDNSIRAMQDPRTIERLARETWCYAKPGETVIHFDPPAPPSNGPAASSK